MAENGGQDRLAASPMLAVGRSLLAIALALAMLAAIPYALLWTLFWSASGSWDFEGSRGMRHWLLVKGSRLDQLGLVAPTARPARYSVRFQEGASPGWRVAIYESSNFPPAIVAAYAERCGAMGLKVTKREPASGSADANPTQARLVCEIEPYLDVEIFAERQAPATATSVSIRVWGSQ